MRYAIPLGAFLLLGLASVLHRNSGSAAPDRQPSWTQTTKPVQPETEGRLPDSVARTVEPTVSPKGRQVEPAVPAVKGTDAAAWRKLSMVLVKELSLTAQQQEMVDQVLRDRAEEIRVCQEAILKAKLLDTRHYEWQVARMKESWFLRIDRALDSAQHRRFAVLADQGFFNDGLGITEVPGMTVLD